MISTESKSGPTPFGQTHIERAAIARMRELHAGGFSLHAISRQLDKEGVPTRSGSPWYSATVGNILQRQGIRTALPGQPPRAPREHASIPTPAPAPAEVMGTDQIALAKTGCMHCNGIGRRDGAICTCVHWNIFNIVWTKLRYCAAGYHCLRPIPLDHFADGGGSKLGQRMQSAEFIADVALTAKRTLSEDDYRLFRFRYLLGASANMCAARLGMDLEPCVQRLQDIEARLGQAFRDTHPYALYPLDDYFRTRIAGGVRPCPVPVVQDRRNGIPLRAPLAPCRFA